MPKKFIAKGAEKTQDHAARFAKVLDSHPCLILLDGPLGAGKTEWVRGFTRAYLKKKKILVTSPTYSIVNTYGAKGKKIYHVDLYRLKSADDLESIGFWEFLRDRNIVIVEWGEMLAPLWPGKLCVYRMDFKIISEGVREITLHGPAVGEF